jgi:magnesium transporter
MPVPSTAAATRALAQVFFDRHPTESARLLESLAEPGVRALLEAESAPRVARLLVRMNPDAAARIIEQMSDEPFVRLVTAMDPVQAAALLVRLDEKKLAHYLDLLPAEIATEYRELMTYPLDSAGRLMDPRVTVFRSDETVAAALARLRAIRDRRVLDVCVVDEAGVLVGLIPLQELAVAEPDEPLSALIREPPVSIQAVSTRDEVVRLLETLRLSSLPVVNLNGKLQGIIRHDALVRAATQDAVENLQAMVGAGREERALSRPPLPSGSACRGSSSIWGRRFWRRRWWDFSRRPSPRSRSWRSFCPSLPGSRAIRGRRRSP